MSSPRILGLLPARGGSKGIPGKNMRPLLGRPLISWAASALSAAVTPARRICSTDDPAIAQAAVAAGLETPWLRPLELASDTSLVIDVISHALRTLISEGDTPYTHIVLVQATSPTVTAKDIDAAVNLAISGQADTVICGFPAGQRHPTTMFSINSNGTIHWLLEEKLRMSRRQDLPPIYIRTGLVYVMRADLVLERGTIYGERILALTVPENRALTIDDEHDFRLAEIMLMETNND